MSGIKMRTFIIAIFLNIKIWKNAFRFMSILTEV